MRAYIRDAMICIDIFRFRDGKIVEHWDNLQELPTAPNASGNSTVNGSTVAVDLDHTEPNKAVRAFVDAVLVNAQMEKITYGGQHGRSRNQEGERHRLLRTDVQ